DDVDGRRRVVSVVLSGRRISDVDLVLLHDIRPVNRLYLDVTAVTDDGVAHIARLDELEVVSLSSTRLTNSGMAHFLNLQNLRMIMIARTRVDDDGLDHLVPLKNLVVLHAPASRITPTGIDRLCKLLPGLRNVQIGPFLLPPQKAVDPPAGF